MKIVHIESGLGNQMLSFCEYLALKKVNPDDEICIETLVYDIPDCNKVICQWNGFELSRIFGINVPDIRDRMKDEDYCRLLQYLKKSEFWNKNWNWPVYMSEAFVKIGIPLINARGNFEDGDHFMTESSIQNNFKDKFLKTRFGYFLKHLLNSLKAASVEKSICHKDEIFYKTDKDILTGQWLSLKYNGNGIEMIDSEIKNSFKFPKLKDERNLKLKELLETTNSVAIHARLGDMYTPNSAYYKYGYFKRAVKFIKRKVARPVFVFFTNTDSVEWCKSHSDIFGLTSEDQMIFVDWNKGEESFRDMQLMSYCKHAIITNSSFGWWGAYFISNPKKITISPEINMNTTHHCF